MASSTTSARIGRSSALGWVRVLMTMVSPSFSRSLSMATDGSCHRKPSGVSDVRRRLRRPTRCARRRPGRRPAGRSASIPTARPVSVSPPGQRDADVPPDGGARRRRTTSASRLGGRLAAVLPGDVRLPAALSSTQTEQVGPVGGLALDREGRRLGHRQLVGGHADVEPDPDDRGRTGRRSRPARPGSRRPCARPRRPSRTSLGHFTAASNPAVAQRRAHGVPGQQRAATATSAAGTVGRSSTENVSADRGGVSHDRSRRPRPAVWCSATITSPSGRAGAAPARRRARWSSRPPRPPPPDGSGEPRSASRAGRAGGGIGHGG